METELVAATVENGLMAEVRGSDGVLRLARFDSTGQVTFEDWLGDATDRLDSATVTVNDWRHPRGDSDWPWQAIQFRATDASTIAWNPAGLPRKFQVLRSPIGLIPRFPAAQPRLPGRWGPVQVLNSPRWLRQSVPPD